AICHEHLTYFSLAALERVFHDAGLELVAAERTDINGGSVCCFVARRGAHTEARARYAARTAAIRAAETDLGLTGDQPYAAVAARVHRHRPELRALTDRMRGQGRTIHVYGAPTKGNVLLQFCGLDRGVIDVAAERNPLKFGASTLGTNIPIVSEAESRRLR